MNRIYQVIGITCTALIAIQLIVVLSVFLTLAVQLPGVIRHDIPPTSDIILPTPVIELEGRTGENDPYFLLNPYGREYVNVDSLITIYTDDDANRRHSELIRLIWGSEGLPTRLPVKVLWKLAML